MAEAYAAELKALYDKAHGFRNRKTRDEDLVRRFLNGLRDDDIRFAVKYKEPATIDEAVFHIVNFLQTKSIRNKRGRDNFRIGRKTAEEHEGKVYERYTRHILGKSESIAQENQVTRTKRISTVSKTEEGHLPDTGNQTNFLETLLQRIEKLEDRCSDNRRKNNPR